MSKSSYSFEDETAIRFQSTISDKSNELKGVTLQGKRCLPNFLVSETLHKRLLQFVNMKKQKAGLLYGTVVNKYSFELQLLKIVDDFREQEVFNKILYEEQACAIVIINNKQLLKDRLLYQVQKCKEGFVISNESFKNQGISVLEQVYLSVMRMFLVVKEQKQQIKIKQYSLFPNINFTIKTLKLSSYKFDSSSLLKKLIHSETQPETSFKQELERGTYGFLVCNETKLGVVKRNDLSVKSKSIVGMWIHLRGIKKESEFELNPNSHRLIWGLASMFVTNKNISKTNVLANSQLKRNQFVNSFLLCVFSEVSTKPYIYQIEVMGSQNKWLFMENQQHILMPNVPLNFNMGNQCSVQSVLISQSSNKLQIDKVNIQKIEEQREFLPNFKRYQSDNIATERNSSQISFSKKDSKSNKFFSNDTFARSEADALSLRQSQFYDKTSEKSYDQKDIQIRQLKKQLEFYKERYQNLERILLNQSIYQQQSYAPMFNQFGVMANGIQNGIQSPLQPPHSIPPPAFPYMNYPMHPQQIPPSYYPIPQPQFQQYSSQVTNNLNIAPLNKISQSSVVDNNKQITSNFSFVKKQSNTQLNNYPSKQPTQQTTKENLKLNSPETHEQHPQPNQIIPQTNQQQPSQQSQNQTIIKTQQSKQHTIEQHFALDITNNHQQFLQFYDKQIDLNLSNIPHQRSPKPCNTDNQAPQLQDYSSLTYSYSRHYPNDRYIIPNEDSHDYQEDEQAKIIERLYQNKFK